MSWIKTIPLEEAEGILKKIYRRVKGPNDQIDNILLAHSLRPHTLTGHMALYKNVLHHRDNNLPKWYLECIGVYVSLLNKCQYCVDHHFAGLSRLIDDSTKSEEILTALQNDLSTFFTDEQTAGLTYAKVLTLSPGSMMPSHFQDLLSHGLSEGEILEINQVTAYFNYANRTVLGLGVTTDGDVLGLSPSREDESEWGHG